MNIVKTSTEMTSPSLPSFICEDDLAVAVQKTNFKNIEHTFSSALNGLTKCMEWGQLQFSKTPRVTLDRTLTYKYHIDKTRSKLTSRDNHLRKRSWELSHTLLEHQLLLCPTHVQSMPPLSEKYQYTPHECPLLQQRN